MILFIVFLACVLGLGFCVGQMYSLWKIHRIHKKTTALVDAQDYGNDPERIGLIQGRLDVTGEFLKPDRI